MKIPSDFASVKSEKQTIGNIKVYTAGDFVQIQGYITIQNSSLTVKSPYTIGTISDSNLCPPTDNPIIFPAIAYNWSSGITTYYTPAFVQIKNTGAIELIPYEKSDKSATSFYIFAIYAPK